MKPIETGKRDEIIIAKNQAEYLPLPALRCPQGNILIQWKLTLRERLKLLFTGIIFHEVLTFNRPLQPIAMTVDAPEAWREQLK